MTPKEKAKELTWKFMPWEEEVYLDEITRQRDLVAAKECARICSEELMAEFGKYTERYEQEIFDYEKNFWQEVKSEIEKL